VSSVAILILLQCEVFTDQATVHGFKIFKSILYTRNTEKGGEDHNEVEESKGEQRRVEERRGGQGEGQTLNVTHVAQSNISMRVEMRHTRIVVVSFLCCIMREVKRG